MSKDPRLGPLPPPGHSQVALVIILVLVFVFVLTGRLWGNDTGVSIACLGQAPASPSQGNGVPDAPSFS